MSVISPASATLIIVISVNDRKSSERFCSHSVNSMDAVDLYPKPLQEESVNPPNSTSCPPPLKKV